ncbi:MAG TPA: hypothetical protein VHE13_14830 [Opitutus sp.]|nr:hypothetical protein [Opitutus sp.]
MNKRTALAILLALVGAGGLLVEYRATLRLRADNARLRADLDRLAAENRRLPALPTQTTPTPSANDSPTPLQPGPAAASAQPSFDPPALRALRTSLARPRDAQQLSRLHERYDSFLRDRGLSPDEIDRWIALMMEKENVRLDLQDAMRAQDLPGGTEGIEDLRAKLTGNLWRQLLDSLGPDGAAAFADFEATSAMRGYLQPLTPALSAANVPLSPAQSDQLVHLLIANNHPQRINATDLGTENRIDWTAVVAQARHFLTPSQLAGLEDFAHRQQPP